MKNKNVTSIILILIFVVLVSVAYSKFWKNNYFSPPPFSQYLIEEQTNIVAIWTSENDPSYRLDFRADGTCYEYYESSLVATHNYSISNSSPQCGETVLVDATQETSYLQMINVSDGNTQCYEINGIGEFLSLTQVGTANLSVFFK